MSADTYKNYKEYRQLHWYCAQCNKGIAKLYTLLNEMSARQDGFEKSLEKLKDTRDIDSMKEKFGNLSVEVKGLNDKLDLTSERINETDTKVETAIEAKLIQGIESRVDCKVKILKEDVEESIEIDKRKGNLIFHGVKELHRAESGDDGIDHDRLMIEEILKAGLKMDPTRHVEEVLRIGRYDEGKINDGKIRPIRVKVKTVEGRSEMLKRAKQLKDNDFKNVYIAPDLTRKQQLFDKNLRERLKQFRNDAEEGERNLFRIKSGKIIKNEKGKQELIMYQPTQTLTQ